MRTITIPPPVAVDPSVATNKDGSPLLMPLSQWLTEFVWPQKVMREKTGLALALIDKLGSSKSGEVSLTDEEHELLLQCARAADYPPLLSVPFLRFQHAINSARYESAELQMAAE